jgi:hypothetical protein
MHQRKLSRVIAAGLLAALLALPAPVHAAARNRGTVELWDWLAGLWERGAAALAVWDRGTEKELATDPDGEPAAPSGAGIDPTGGTDQGHGIDPNG